MRLRSLNKRERNVLYITILTGLLALAFEFVVVPLEAGLDRLNQDIVKKESLLNRYSNLVLRGENIESLYESYKNTFQTGADAETVTVNLFKDIRVAAGKFGVSLEGIKPLNRNLGKEFSVTSLEIDLIADFASIFELIRYLEDLPSFTRILSFRISPMGSNTHNLRCRIVVCRLFI